MNFTISIVCLKFLFNWLFNQPSASIWKLRTFVFYSLTGKYLSYVKTTLPCYVQMKLVLGYPQQWRSQKSWSWWACPTQCLPLETAGDTPASLLSLPSLRSTRETPSTRLTGRNLRYTDITCTGNRAMLFNFLTDHKTNWCGYRKYRIRFHLEMQLNGELLF